MSSHEFLKYYIRVTNVRLFNKLVEEAEGYGARDLEAGRQDGYYTLKTNDNLVWKELFLYGQVLAGAQDEFIEAGEY